MTAHYCEITQRGFDCDSALFCCIAQLNLDGEIRRDRLNVTEANSLLEKIAGKIKKAPFDFVANEDYYYIAKDLMETDEAAAVSALKALNAHLEKVVPRAPTDELMRDFYDLHKRSLLGVARQDFESYIPYH